MEDYFYKKTSCDIKNCKEKILEIQAGLWKNDLTSKLKLRFYRTFKNTLAPEPYVLYNKISMERSITAQLFRASLTYLSWRRLLW